MTERAAPAPPQQPVLPGDGAVVQKVAVADSRVPARVVIRTAPIAHKAGDKEQASRRDSHLARAYVYDASDAVKRSGEMRIRRWYPRHDYLSVFLHFQHPNTSTVEEPCDACCWRNGGGVYA